MRTLVTVGVLAGLVGFAACGPSKEAKIFPYDYDVVQLDNGFKAYLIDAGAPGQIAYVSMVRTGSRDEVEPGRSGYAHFFEHMMFRGTKKYPQYDDVTSSMGASRNAFTSNDMTVFYLVASNEYLDKIMDLESDRFQNLSYSESDFRTEAGSILGEYQQGARSPYQFLNQRLLETAYDAHTYRHTVIGYEADVRAMPEGYEYSRSFYDRFYRPENVVLVIAGDFDHAKAKQLIEQYYGGWEPGYQAPAVPEEPEQTAAREKTIEYPGRTLPVLSINYKAPAWSATDTLAVATEVLGAVAFGPNSDLHKKLVIQDRRVQYLRGGFGLARDPALVDITTMVNDPSDLPAIEKEILDTVERFRTQPVDARLLADTKSSMKYGFLMGLETAQNVAFSLIQVVINTGGIEGVEDYYNTLEAVTPEHVQRAAERVLTANRRTTMTMVQAAR